MAEPSAVTVMTPAELDPLTAVNFALDHCHGVTDCFLFLDDWREGDLSAWPEYRVFARASAQDGAS